MTATLTQPVRDTSAPELRVPTISARLLPPEIVESRRTKVVRRAVLLALAMVVLLLAGWFVLASLQAVVARDSRTAAERDVQRLIDQQHDFAHVTQAEAESRRLETQLSVLLATDVRWSRLLRSVRSAAPDEVQLTGVVASFDEVAGLGAPAPAGPAEPLGTLTISGTAPGKPMVAAYVDALASPAGVANPQVSTATLHEGVVDFRIQLDITESALRDPFSTTDNDSTGED